FRSGDAGVHWSRVQTDQVDALAVSPRDPNVVYASTPKTLLKTVDGGVSWKPLPIEQPWVSALVIDESNPAVLYAAAGRVWRSLLDVAWRAAGEHDGAGNRGGSGPAGRHLRGHLLPRHVQVERRRDDLRVRQRGPGRRACVGHCLRSQGSEHGLREHR